MRHVWANNGRTVCFAELEAVLTLAAVEDIWLEVSASSVSHS